MIDKGRILVVDDQKIVLIACQLELEYAGFEVKTTLSGLEAVAMIKSEPFDLVYVDLLMPEMNGVETCLAIKKYSPRTEVVLISGSPVEVEEHQTDFLKAGGRLPFIEKPFEKGILVKTARDIFDEKSFLAEKVYH